jgi:hypothetical protein
VCRVPPIISGPRICPRSVHEAAWPAFSSQWWNIFAISAYKTEDFGFAYLVVNFEQFTGALPEDPRGIF